jgi:predicted deacylase
MSRILTVDGESVRPGEDKVIDLNIARLVSGTKIDLPIHVYRSKKPGPVIMLSGGLHGDEVDGVEIIRRLIREKTFKNLKKGSVIAIPVLNIYGFLNFSREVPDGKDVNRFFPGSKTGSLASRVAYNLKEKVLREIDFGIDFHTGGANRYNYPQSRFAPEDSKAKEIANAFNAPISLESGLIDKSLRNEAFKMGKSIVVFEGGEAMRFDELSIKEGMRGARRVLHHYGMLGDADQAQNNTHCASSQWVRAKRSGLFQSDAKSGEWVDKNDIMGTLSDPFGAKEIKVKSPVDGIIIGHNNAPVVNQGDALFHLGLVD